MPGRALDVLIVEDEVLLAAELEFLVQEVGYHPVGCAMSSDEAVDLAKSLHRDRPQQERQLALEALARAKPAPEQWDILAAALAEASPTDISRILELFGPKAGTPAGLALARALGRPELSQKVPVAAVRQNLAGHGPEVRAAFEPVLAKLDHCVALANARDLAPLLLGDLFEHPMAPSLALGVVGVLVAEGPEEQRAARAALDEGVSANLAGGTHHAFADRAAMLHPRHHLLTDVTALAEIEAVEEVHIGFMREGVAIGEIDAAHRQAKADAPRLVIGPVSRRVHGVARDNRSAAEIGAGIGGEGQNCVLGRRAGALELDFGQGTRLGLHQPFLGVALPRLHGGLGRLEDANLHGLRSSQ